MFSMLLTTILFILLPFTLSLFSSILRRLYGSRFASPSSTSSPNTRLPNGIDLYTTSGWIDVKLSYKETFERQSMMPLNKDGGNFIELDDNSIVFDVGSHIGMFPIYLLQKFPNIHLHCFEPLPETYNLCEKNLKLHAASRFGVSVFTHRLALSNHTGEESFIFNPFLPMAAAASAQHEAMYALGRKHGLTPWLHAAFTDMSTLVERKFMQNFLKSLALHLEKPVSSILVIALFMPYLIYFIISSVIHSYFFERTLPCRVSTLSSFLNSHFTFTPNSASTTSSVTTEENGVSTTAYRGIDLLKIDVEGSELAVIDGIADEHWRRISQLAIEVHDVNGRVERICRKLLEKGFEIRIRQKEWEAHKLLEIYNVFARRPKVRKTMAHSNSKERINTLKDKVNNGNHADKEIREKASTPTSAEKIATLTSITPRSNSPSNPIQVNVVNGSDS